MPRRNRIRRGRTTCRPGFHLSGFFPPEKGPRSYFNELLIEVNWVLSVVPRPFTAAIIASEMPAAIRPYSIAVAPD
jgi:hypothetical protein